MSVTREATARAKEFNEAGKWAQHVYGWIHEDPRFTIADCDGCLFEKALAESYDAALALVRGEPTAPLPGWQSWAEISKMHPDDPNFTIERSNWATCFAEDLLTAVLYWRKMHGSEQAANADLQQECERLRGELAHWKDCHGATADALVVAEQRAEAAEQRVEYLERRELMGEEGRCAVGHSKKFRYDGLPEQGMEPGCVACERDEAQAQLQALQRALHSLAKREHCWCDTSPGPHAPITHTTRCLSVRAALASPPAPEGQ